MIVDKTRELVIKAKLYVLYNETPPIANGYYSSASSQTDPENTNPINRNAQQDRFQTLGGKNYNLNSFSFFQNISNLMNAQIPPVNQQIGATRCTFAYGSIEPDKSHPIFNLLKGPTDQYSPNFIGDSGLNILEQTPKVPVDPDLSVPIMPFSTINPYGASKVLTTYNIWALVDQKGNLITTDSKKHKGQITTNPVLLTKSDTIGESSIYLSSPSETSYIKRIYPLSKDVIYDDDSTLYCVKKSVDSAGKTTSSIISQKVTERGSTNNSFHLSISPSFSTNNINGKESIIIVKVGSATPKHNNLLYQFEFTPYKNELYTITPGGQKLKQNVKFPVTGNEDTKSSVINIYMHFLNDIALIGFSPDVSQWQNLSPLSQNKNSDSSKNKFINFLPQDATITIQCSYASCGVQYGTLAFNNFDSRSDDYKPHITFSHDTSSPTFELDPYTGYKNVKDNGVSHYQDSRSGNTQVEFVNSYVNNGFGQVRYNSVIGGPVLHKIENKLLNNKGKPVYSLAPDNSLLYPIGGQDPNKLPAYDISEYIESWVVRYNNGDSNLIFGEATVTLKNFDAGYSQDTKYNGMNILSLIEKNKIVIELSAGYNDELEIFFQGFIVKSTTERSASMSQTEFECTDVGKMVLDSTRFKNYVLFGGAKLKYSLYRCFEHSSFYQYLRMYENPGYIKSLEANMSYTQLDNQQVYAIEGDTIISKLDILLNKFFTKQTEMPFLRFDYSKQVFEINWRYDSKYRDSIKLFGIDLTDANTRDAYFKENVEDWHGLLSGPFRISTENGNFYKSFEARGSGYEGFSFSRYSYPQANGFQSIINGDYSVQGYVGYDSKLYQPLDKNFPDFLSVDTWLRNKINILQKPIYSISFSCYVTRPLNPHGSFVIKSMMNNNTKVTDAYLYTSLTYQCNKKENIIIATVTGQQAIKLEK
jgi:hypothetical protein